MKYYWLKKWSKRLGIREKIKFEFIPKSMITNNCNVHLVGICGTTIYHDRRLTEEDIVHELLHFKHPRYKEKTIRRKERELCQK